MFMWLFGALVLPVSPDHAARASIVATAISIIIIISISIIILVITVIIDFFIWYHGFYYAMLFVSTRTPKVRKTMALVSLRLGFGPFTLVTYAWGPGRLEAMGWDAAKASCEGRLDEKRTTSCWSPPVEQIEGLIVGTALTPRTEFQARIPVPDLTLC